MKKIIFHHYDIAFKTKNMTAFEIVKKPKYGWIADPFLVKYQGDIYLFAEIFLYLTERNGVIGYAKFKDGKFGEWTVTMDKHWHLSYPNVYVKKDKLYMCPESYQLGEVVLYELQEFPDKWKKVKSYITDVEFCDTTFLDDVDQKYAFTFEREKPPHGNGCICKIENGIFSDVQVFSNSLEGSRCGGKVFKENGKFIRVAQNCYPEYGSGLIFYEIESIWPQYKEKEIRRISLKDINLDGKEKYCGIHTYNRFEDIEVIDLREKSSSREEYIAHKRVHKVFVNKYRGEI